MDQPSPHDSALPATDERASTSAVSSAAPPPQQASAPLAPVAPPTYPGMPGVPLSWSTLPPTTSTLYSAPQPGTPMYPPAQQQGVYPTYPSSPAPYPGGPLMPYGAPMTVPLYKNDSPMRRALAGAFPAWLSALIAVGAVGLVGVAFFAAVLVGQADWANGARIAGLLALALAALTLVVAVVRGALGRRAISLVVLSALLVAGLAAVGAGGVFASPRIHNYQASALESAQNWQGAITEYQLGGEQAPNAPDIARTLDEQGEQLAAQGHYAAAIAAFATVTAQYGQSGPAVDRANTGTFNAYSAWVTSQAGDVKYADAIAFFGAYQTSSTCSASCQSATAAIEAQALYQYGTQLLGQGNLTDAVTQFETLTTTFATSSYAAQAHQQAATALLTLGKQQLTTSCADTTSTAYTLLVQTYQKLAQSYADTAEGAAAKTALAQPQTVTGFLYGAPKTPPPTVHLSKSINPDAFSYSDEYQATFDATSGLFTFKSVALGSYFLNTSRDDGSFTHFVYWGFSNGTIPSVKVLPLCTTSLTALFYSES